MGSPQLSFQQGKFTSTGASGYIALPFKPGIIEVFNYTQAASTANPGVVKRSWWQFGMTAGYYQAVKNTDGAATDYTAAGTSAGFTLFDLANPSAGATATISTINQNAAATVTTSAPHGYAVGDLVELIGTTGMLQVATYTFQIQTVPTTTTFTIPLDSSGFAAGATAGTTRLFYRPLYTPRRALITTLTAANPAVVTTATNHGFVAGDVIEFVIPAAYGMVEASTLTAKVVSVTTTTITTDLDSSGFTAFAFPTSANYVTSKAYIVPAGASSSNVVDATTNSGFVGVNLGTAVVGASNDVMYWKAWYPDAFQTALSS